MGKQHSRGKTKLVSSSRPVASSSPAKQSNRKSKSGMDCQDNTEVTSDDTRSSSDDENVDDPQNGQSSSSSDSDLESSGHSDIESETDSKSSQSEHRQSSEQIPKHLLKTRSPKKKDSDGHEDQSFAELSTYLKRCLTTKNLGITQNYPFGFNMLLDCIKECLLTHRWQEASQILEIMCLYPKHQREDALWKYGMEILYNHPDSTPDLVEQFTRHIDEIHVQRKRKRLERGLYQLSRGQSKEAEMTLMSATCMTQSGKNLEEYRTEKYWMKTITGYLGMLQYVKLKEDGMVTGSEEHSTTQEEQAHDKLPEVKQACENLEAVLDLPGVWDIFVTKQVELLETVGKIQEARKILENYCNSCPDNPNAYRYLYRHLKRTNTDREDMIEVLKDYVKRVPSDVLALDLVCLLQQSAKPENPNYSDDVAMITNTLFNMLDYSCWYKSLPPWRALAKYIMKITKKQDRVAMDAARTCWEDRDWWLSYHFTAKAAKTLIKKNKKIALHKAMVLMFTQTTNSPFVTVIRKYLTKKTDNDSLKQLDLARKCIEFGLR